MSWKIGENKYPQMATFWKIVEDHDTWAVVSLGTSTKDKEKKWHNSNWGFCRFVGKNAYNGIKDLEEKDRIIIKSGLIDQEAYTDKDGKKVYPKYPKITIFAWEKYEPESQDDDAPPVVEESEEDDNDLPF